MNTYIVIVIVACVFILIQTAMNNRSRQERERLRVIEKAIQSGNVDRDLMEQLTWQLSGKPEQRAKLPPKQPGAIARFLTAIGWLGLFVGGALCAVGGLFKADDPMIAGVIVGLVGFGVLTIPFAVRELEARRSA